MFDFFLRMYWQILSFFGNPVFFCRGYRKDYTKDFDDYVFETLKTEQGEEFVAV